MMLSSRDLNHAEITFLHPQFRSHFKLVTTGTVSLLYHRNSFTSSISHRFYYFIFIAFYCRPKLSWVSAVFEQLRSKDILGITNDDDNDKGTLRITFRF